MTDHCEYDVILLLQPLGLCRKTSYLSVAFSFSGDVMKYDKPPLSIESQVDRLIARGLEGDRSLMIDRIRAVNYYRLSGYLYPYRISDSDSFRAGTEFEIVWNHYAFDRRLRLLMMDAIERIEIAVRTQLAFHHASAYGSGFAYADLPLSLPGLNIQECTSLINRIRNEKLRSKDVFVSHFNNKYGDQHYFLPIWMAVETMSFGSVQRLFKGASSQVKKNTADYFKMPHQVIGSWLHALSVVRNQCAHHGRLWNKELGVKPKIPRARDYPDWHNPDSICNNRIYAVLSICRYCLKIVAPQSRWPLHLMQLLDDFPDISVQKMGFSENWRDAALWKTLQISDD